MRMGIKRVRDDPRDIQENYREVSLASRKRWDLDSGQGRPKRGQKRKGGQDRRERTRRNLNIPNPDRGKVSTFASDKISPILRPEIKEMSRGSNHQHYIAMKIHFVTAH